MGESVRRVARWYGNERFRGPVGGQAGCRLRGWWWRCSAALEATRARDEGTRGTRWGWLGGHHRGRRSGRKGEGMGRREGAEGWQRGNGRAEEATRRRRYGYDDEALVEFVSTRYHSSGSICPHPSFCVSSSLSFPLTLCLLSFSLALSVAFVISIRSLARFFLRRSIPQPLLPSSLASFLTLAERVLSTRPSRSPPAPSCAPHASFSRDSRIGSRSASLWLSPFASPSPAHCFSLVLSTSPHRTRAHRVSIRLRPARSVSPALSPVFSLSLSLSQALLRVVLSRFSRSFFRRGTASRSSLRWIAMRETDRARGGETGDGG